MNLEEKNRKSLLNFASQALPVLAFFVLALVVFYIGCSFYWSVFSERDISRAEGWLNGQFYWPGPEMSGGNNLPGPFFYFLLFPAFLMGENTYSQVALWTIIWFALTYTVAFSFISKIISHKESLLIFLVTFILNIKTTNYSVLLNPEFAIMFHVLALTGLYYWREKKNSLYLYLTGLVIALGIQAHLLVALHILTVLLVYIIDKSERKKTKTLLLFLFLALSPLLIYNVLKYFHFFETSGRYYDEHINWVLRNIFSEEWFRNIKQMTVPFIPFFSFCLAITFWRKHKTKKPLLKPSTKNLLIMTAIPVLTAFFIARHLWYLFFIPVFSIILISKWLDDLLPNNSNKKINFLLIYTLFTIICILASKYKFIGSFLNPLSLFSISLKKINLLYFFVFFLIVITSLRWRRETLYKSVLLGLCLFVSAQGALYLFPKNYQKSFTIEKSFSITPQSYKEFYPLMKRIYLETGWTPKTAMKRIFNIGMHPDRSLLADYAMTVEKLNKPTTLPLPPLLHNKQNTSLKQNYRGQEKALAKNKAQGYFIIQHLQKFMRWTKTDWKNHLSQPSLLAPILRQEIKEDKIVIQEPELYDQLWLIPYNTTENSLFPTAFHNIGQPYYWEEPEWLKKCDQTHKFKNEKGLFYCRVLPGHLQRAGLKLSFSQKTKSFLNIQFFGVSLGIAKPTSNVNGSLLWSDIQMYLDCNKKSFHWTLPDIGNHNHEAMYPKKQAKMLLAPLKLQIPLKGCKKSDIERIELTWTEKHTRREQN
ncbi:MAG: hypothetical protein OXJ52_08275 [Oligoflexia bacterium]|nr:hypothetical protein [Oligoflexia bacterium]